MLIIYNRNKCIHANVFEDVFEIYQFTEDFNLYLVLILSLPPSFIHHCQILLGKTFLGTLVTGTYKRPCSHCIGIVGLACFPNTWFPSLLNSGRFRFIECNGWEWL